MEDVAERAQRFLDLLARAAGGDGSQVQPAALGTLLEATMSGAERHERGAHYTPEAAIFAHVVRPSLVDPWRERIRAAATEKELLALHAALTRLRILDPACGSGNFLHVAYRALVRLEQEILEKMLAPPTPSVDPRQLFGIDADPLAVALAKVTLARRTGLSPEDLDANVRCADALFCEWPAADLIVGNPPFQSKNKMQQELGADYVQRLRRRYPDVPGRADYCVYWFRRAHDELGPGARAGLVGTNTIRQNDSREGGLAYVVEQGGTITEAVSSMVWPGAAVVHVSIVNWIKGELPGPKKLSWQEGDAQGSPWKEVTLGSIPASLSPDLDVTGAKALAANAGAGACGQGQTHGHEGFLLTAAEAHRMCSADPRNAEVIFPYLTGEELLTQPGGRPTRWVIDFHPRDEREARRYAEPFQRVEDLVLPGREAAVARERARNARLDERGNRHHERFLRRFWLLGYPRTELIEKLSGLSRYVACGAVTKRPIFELVSRVIRPNATLIVFPFEDDYSFGVLQSAMHWSWLTARCSTLKRDFRYTSSTVFDSFPWPQSPGVREVAAVAEAAVALRALRRDLLQRHGSLRALYASMEQPGPHALKDAHATLDAAVRVAYGMGPRAEPLAFLLALNQTCAVREAAGEAIVGPGLPPGLSARQFVTRDAVQPQSGEIPQPG